MTEYIIKAYALKKPGSMEISQTRNGRLNIFSYGPRAHEYRGEHRPHDEVYPIHIIIDSDELLEGVK